MLRLVERLRTVTVRSVPAVAATLDGCLRSLDLGRILQRHFSTLSGDTDFPIPVTRRAVSGVVGSSVGCFLVFGESLDPD